MRPDKPISARKIVDTFLPININLHSVCSKEPSHVDGSFCVPTTYDLFEKLEKQSSNT